MRYQILYKNNEVFISEKPDCYAHVCTCALDNGLKCSYPIQEAKKRVAQYYERRAVQVRHQDYNEFIQEFLIRR